MSQLDDRRLEAALRKALGPPSPAPTWSEHSEDSIAQAFVTVAHRRRRRHYTSAVTLCIVLMGALLYAGAGRNEERGTVQSQAPQEVSTTELSRAARLDTFDDPVQLATYLVRTTSASGNGGADFPWLREDAEARKKVLGYLDHQYSAVRRAAASALATCKVLIPTEKLVQLLVEEDEQLETPIELAGTGDSSAVFASALAGRRRSTILYLLSAIQRQSWGARGDPGGDDQGADVELEALLPFLDENDAQIRRQALFAIEPNPAFEIGSKVRAMLADDPDPGVREAAAILIKRKLGEAGLDELLAHLYTETAPEVERMVVGWIRHLPDALELARLKLEQRDSTDDVLVHYAGILLRHGDQQRGVDELRRAFREGGGHAVYQAAYIARKLESPDLREDLQAAWERLPLEDRSLTTASILVWDLLRGKESDMLSALALVERAQADRRRAGIKLGAMDLLVRGTVSPYLESDFETVRASARDLLERWKTNAD